MKFFRSRAGAYAFVLTGCAVVALIAACASKEMPLFGPEEQFRQISCPHGFQETVNGVIHTRIDIADGTPYGFHDITNIPEFHDCQRLVGQRRVQNIGDKEVTRAAYGPLISIYASWRLPELTSDLDNGFVEPPDDQDQERGPCDDFSVLNPGNPLGMLMSAVAQIRMTALVALNDCENAVAGAASSGSSGGQTSGNQASGSGGREIPVVQIYNWDKTAYPVLGIGPSFNCLYLARRGAGYVARMVQMNTVNDCPFGGPPPGNIGKELQVRVIKSPGHGAANYPPVARWDRDPTTALHYIGVMCEAAWCEVHSGGSSSPSYEIDPAPLITPWGQVPLYTPTFVQKVYEVKGWYDEQVLAVRPEGSAGHALSNSIGTIVPTAALAWYKVADFENAPRLVANVYLSNDNGVYFSKYKFKKALMGDTPNKIYLSKVPNDTLWFAHFVSAQGDTITRPVIRTEHKGVTIPATARWRWIYDDETVWTKCDEGCCRVN